MRLPVWPESPLKFSGYNDQRKKAVPGSLFCKPCSMQSRITKVVKSLRSIYEEAEVPSLLATFSVGLNS